MTGIQRLVHTSEIDAGTEQDVMGLFITLFTSVRVRGIRPFKKKERFFFDFFILLIRTGITKKGSRSTFNLVLQ